MKPKLTPKQKVFVTEVAKGKSGTQAALTAYDTDSPKTASVIATENLAKPSVKQALEPIFAKHDINLDSAIAPIGQALKAQKVIITGQGDQAFAEVVDDVELRLKGSDRALKLLGINQEVSGNTFNFVQVIQGQKDKYGL